MVKKLSPYSGIILGAMYGFILRLFGEGIFAGEMFSIYSVTFIWITPIVISIIPILISSNQLYHSRIRKCLYPMITVALVLIVSVSTGVEDLFCILILGFPYFVIAGVVGFLVSLIVKRRIQSKGIYSILLLPVLLNPIESLLPNSSTLYTVENSIVINASDSVVWKTILEVPEISASEYTYGFFNHVGIPRPIKSQFEVVNDQRFRVGYFSDGLTLVESVTKYDSLKTVSFFVHVDLSQLRDKPTDQHLLKSGYFNFQEIKYTLSKLDEDKTVLTLRCDYSLHSKMNAYASFWANAVIGDFEIRLLDALKGKLENTRK
jgi:uncharacterized membrane protein YvlD (DUF360 family)